MKEPYFLIFTNFVSINLLVAKRMVSDNVVVPNFENVNTTKYTFMFQAPCFLFNLRNTMMLSL